MLTSTAPAGGAEGAGQPLNALGFDPAMAFVDRDPELSYCLDSSVMLGEITPMERLVFDYATPAGLELQRLRQADDQQCWTSHWLRNTARHYLDGLTREQQYLWALADLQSFNYGIQALHERMDFVVRQKVLADLGVEEMLPFGITQEGIQLESAHGQFSFSSAEEVTPETVRAYVQPIFEEPLSRLQSDITLAKAAVEWIQNPINRAHAKRIASTLLLPLDAVEGVLDSLSPSAKGHRCHGRDKQLAKARNAVKKALKLSARCGQEENVRLLVSGDEVVVSHPDSQLQFKLRAHQSEGWLVNRTLNPGTSAPYDLSVQTKQGVHLARLCVLFTQTPVLDQLLALSMFVQTGNELELLEKANWFALGPQVETWVAENYPPLLGKVTAIKGNPGGAPFGIPMSRSCEFWRPWEGPVHSWIGELLVRPKELAREIISSAHGQLTLGMH